MNLYIITDDNQIVEREEQALYDEWAEETNTPYGIGRVDFICEKHGYEVYTVDPHKIITVVDWFETRTQAVTESNELNKFAFLPSYIRNAKRFAMRSYIKGGSFSYLHGITEFEDKAQKWLNLCAKFDFQHNADAPLAFPSRAEAELYLREKENE